MTAQFSAPSPEAARIVVDRSPLARLVDLNAACRAIAGTDTLQDLLKAVTEAARNVIGTHQAVASRLVDGWASATTYVSLSDKYAGYRGFDAPPQGLGVVNVVTRENRTLRLNADELRSHPEWRGLVDAPGHPPLDDYLAAPLISRSGRNIGLIQLSDKLDGSQFTEDDEVLLVQVAQMASATLEHVELLERERAVHHQLEERSAQLQLLYEDRSRVARALQRSLLPPSLPAIPGVDVAARYQAGSEAVGGDFYDVFPLRGSRWGVVIGDVRGKGPEAAALTALSRHSARTAAMLRRHPRNVLEVMNEALHDIDDDEQFCSAAYLRLTTGRAPRLDYASGGHPPMLLVRADGTTDALGPTGPLIGLFLDIRVADRSVELGAGDTLVAYTDGITEARRSGEQFGFDRLEALVVAMRDQPAADIAKALASAAEAFGADGEDDDAAVVVLRLDTE